MKIPSLDLGFFLIFATEKSCRGESHSKAIIRN